MNTIQKIELPEKVIICEVAPRDGFQAEHEWIPTEEKISIIRQLAKTGIQSMEITSFCTSESDSSVKGCRAGCRKCSRFNKYQISRVSAECKRCTESH